MSDTIEIHIWQGSSFDSYDDVLSDEPDVYEIPVADTEYGRTFEVDDSERVVLADDIDHHGTYAIDVPNEHRPVTVNIHTNDSYHDPEDWGKPIERGLTFHESDGLDPFQTEIWGRVMMWIEVEDE